MESLFSQVRPPLKGKVAAQTYEKFHGKKKCRKEVEQSRGFGPFLKNEKSCGKRKTLVRGGLKLGAF